MKHHLIALFTASILCATSSVGSMDLRDKSFPTPDKQSLRMEMTVTPAFPNSLVVSGVTEGLARILISVDERGVLVDWLTLAYSHELFAKEAISALERWHFDPMLVRGQPVACQTELVFNFEAKSVVVSMSGPDMLNMIFNSRIKQLQYRPCLFRDLDRIPIPVLAPGPYYPKELVDRGVRGSVTVEFFIDESGTVRMPAVIASAHEELSPLAVQALANWRFEPPTQRGQPVLTRVRQRFDFNR